MPDLMYRVEATTAQHGYWDTDYDPLSGYRPSA